MDIGPQNASLSPESGSREGELAAAARDAETLLRYAAQSGIEVPADAAVIVVQARAEAAGVPLAPADIARFYAAYARLAARLKPVTIDTLRVPEASTRRALRRNGVISILLAVAVMACSIVTFLTTSMSAEIETGIQYANELAVKLRDQVGPPKAAIGAAEICVQPTSAPDPPLDVKDIPLLNRELQEFSTLIRTLLTSAIKLEQYVLQREYSPLDTEEKASLWRTRPRELLQLNPELIDHRAEAFCKIYAYEDVRNFAKNVRANALAFYGALAAYCLPVLYALLGAFAFTLRDFSERVKRRTYLSSSYANTARTIAAMTAGAIISLFSNMGQGLSLSPLALAFLVGYGVEAFFAFLDTLLTAFSATRRGRPDVNSQT